MVKILKEFLKCRVTIFMFLAWALFSTIGYIGRDNIYWKYHQDIKTKPYFVLVLEGVHDGIYPWDLGEQTSPKPEQIQVNVQGEVQNNIEQETPVQMDQPREFVAVDESYFDDAVFIGDSRTVGLHDYGGLEKATFYATVGMNVYDLWTNEFCEVEGAKVTLEEALSTHQYKKVYFQIGINEMGTGTVDSFMQAYQASVKKIAELQPEAIIYVQGIMRVTKDKSDTDEIFNNLGIQIRNERIALLADNVRIFYIDMNEVVCDPQGNLRDDLTFDDLHLYASKYGIWVDFLKTKGIEEEIS